jgi:hypothetical protein
LAPRRGGGWFAPIFGVLIALATVAAIGLAAISPQLGESAASSLPNGWTVAFDTDFASATSDWRVTADCGFARGGLFASSGASPCVYAPSANADYLSQGFRLDATLAPAAQVEQSQAAVVLVGTAYFGITQDGAFALADDATESGNEVRGSSFNWHANGLTTNTIRLEWDGPGTPLVAYTNGYKVGETEYSLSPSSSHTLKVGAASDSQALFTRMTLASASAQG